MLRRLLLLAFGGCLLSATLAAQQTVHPTADNLFVNMPTQKVSRADTSNSSTRLDGLARRLRNAQKVDSIGTLNGPLETVMGMIGDVSVTKTGDILVLDRANRAVRTFSFNGAFRFALGRDGGGPTDLRTPVGLWVTGRGEIVVFDAALGIKYFSVNPKGVASLVRLARVTVSPTSACALGENIYALSPTWEQGSESFGTNKLVHVFTESGRFRRAFGDPYKSTVRIVRSTMSEGEIGCTTDGKVLVALSKLPFVRIYDADGTIRRTIQLADFRIGRNIEGRSKKGGSSIGLDPANPTNSFTLRIREVEHGYVVVQVGLMTLPSLRAGTIWERIDSYLIEANTGRAAFISSSMPMVAAVYGDRLIGFRNEPYPQIEILRLR